MNCRLVDDGKEEDDDEENEAESSTDEEDIPGWDVTVGEGERAFKIRQMPRGRQRRFVIKERGMEMNELKKATIQGFQLHERPEFREENYMLVYGGMPLGEDWFVSDLPVDAMRLEIWDKDDTLALEMKARKEELRKKVEAIEAARQAELTRLRAEAMSTIEELRFS